MTALNYYTVNRHLILPLTLNFKKHMQYTANITSIPRSYLPKDFKVTNWEGLEPFFKELLDRPLNTKEDLESWLKDLSELEAVVSEDAAWRQIRMTCDTENKELEEAFNYFVLHIQPHMQPYFDKLNRKLVQSPLVNELQGPEYQT